MQGLTILAVSLVSILTSPLPSPQPLPSPSPQVLIGASPLLPTAVFFAAVGLPAAAALGASGLGLAIARYRQEGGDVWNVSGSRLEGVSMAFGRYPILSMFGGVRKRYRDSLKCEGVFFNH